MKAQNSRRDFFKKASLTGMAAMTVPFSGIADQSGLFLPEPVNLPESKLIVPKAQGLKITGTFLDEISHDIPHQNWGEKEWDKDFAHMKAIGIDTEYRAKFHPEKFRLSSAPLLWEQLVYFQFLKLEVKFLIRQPLRPAEESSQPFR